MVYTYTPTYYSSFHDTITSLCKSILPFNIKNQRQLPDQKIAKRQSDNLKWQQESFHRILHLIALQKEGMVPENDVIVFRNNMIDALIASPAEQEPSGMIRDKLLFLQDLLYAKCISVQEYHSSKRPLLQRLAVQGVELDCRDVIVGDVNSIPIKDCDDDDEWSVIDLTDKEPATTTVEKSKNQTPIKAFISNAASWRGKGKKEPLNSVDLNVKNDKNGSILMPESSPLVPSKSCEKGKRKPFRVLFGREEKDGSENKDPYAHSTEEKSSNSVKKNWGFEGLKKWKRSESSSKDESTTPYLPLGERSDDVSSNYCNLVASPIGEGPDTKKIKKKLLSDGTNSDFFVDKVLGDNIKKELSRIQTELSSKNPSLNFSDEQIEAISTKLPVDKSDLKNFFPKSWCDRYGEVVLDVVKKEFKDHVGEMETLRHTARENKYGSSKNWVSFDENEENIHPSLYSQEQALLGNNIAEQSHYNTSFNSNPFCDNQNPFYSPSC